jgi:hypothetical protein
MTVALPALRARTCLRLALPNALRISQLLCVDVLSC